MSYAQQLIPRQRTMQDLSHLTDFGLPDVDQIIRSIKGVRPTVLNIDIPFNGNLNDTRSPKNARELPFAVVILAAMTDAEGVTVRLHDVARSHYFSDSDAVTTGQINILAVAGLKTALNPWLPWPWPHVIPPGNYLQVEATDVGIGPGPTAEGAKSIWFKCLAIPSDEYDSGKLDEIIKRRPWFEQTTFTFNGNANQGISPYTSRVEDPILVTGFQTGLQAAKMQLCFPDQGDLYPDPVPIGGIAQPSTSNEHYAKLDPPTWLRRGQKLNYKVQNAGTEASDKIILRGIKDPTYTGK